jgi:CelD/BcsL family acetyltransferase involved in cellulose biosynthesis
MSRDRSREWLSIQGLVVHEHSSPGAFCELEPEWRLLEEQAGLPFASFDWACAWWAHLREEKLGVRDALSLRTIRSADGKLIAIAPMVISRRPSVGPVCVRQLQFFGADPNITEVRGLVALRELRSEAYLALIEHALHNTDCWDSMQLLGMPADLDLGAVASGSNLEGLGQTSEFQLPLPESWEAFRSALPRNIKESLRKCYNSLNRAGLEFRLEVASQPDDVGPALERFFTLHAARAERTDTISHRNVFEAPASRRFLEDLCGRFAERGCLRVFQLVVDHQVVAVRIGFVVGKVLYLYFSGYDPAYAQFSVMTTTVAEAIKYAIANGFERVSLSTGNDVSKARWNPVAVTTRQALLIAPSSRAKLSHLMYRGALSAIETVPALRRATSFLARRSETTTPH